MEVSQTPLRRKEPGVQGSRLNMAGAVVCDGSSGQITGRGQGGAEAPV